MPTPPPVPEVWVARIDPVSHAYEIEQQAVVATVTDGSSHSADSTRLVVVASVRQLEDRAFSGTVDSVALSGPGGASGPLPGLQLPFAFVSAPMRRGVIPSLGARPAPSDPCASPAVVALNALRDVTLFPPDSLRVGTTWADSGTSVVCAGRTTLLLTSRREFRITAHERVGPTDVLHAERTVSVNIRGRVGRLDDTTRVDGTGSGTLRLVMDAATGLPLSANGTASLDLVIRSSAHEERSHQSLSQRVTRRDP